MTGLVAADPVAADPSTSGFSVRTQMVRYAGTSLQVPADWAVVDLAVAPRTCVRFDRHVVYLGVPATEQNCSSKAIGRTEAVLVQPLASVDPTLRPATTTFGVAPALTTATAAEGALTATLGSARLAITVTFGDRPDVARAVVASARRVGSFTAPSLSDPKFTARFGSGQRSLTTVAGVAGSSTYFRGMGFDTCAAPSLSTMSAWKASPYRAVGIYIGGRNRACQWGNLSRTWVSSVVSAGWRLEPLYVGHQPRCTQASGMTDISDSTTTARSQGVTSADDVVAQATQLGIGKGAVMYNDIEAYNIYDAGCSNSTMAFLDGWSRRLHQLGYRSGVYSSASSGIADMVSQVSVSSWNRPDVVATARWDGIATTQEKVLGDSLWSHHQRIKQYAGDVTESWGGRTIQIDRDYFDVSGTMSPEPTAGSISTGVYTITAGGTVNLRSAPTTSATIVGHVSPGARVTVSCQVSGSSVSGSTVWDRLSGGQYVADAFVSTSGTTGYTSGIPRCTFPYLVSSASLNVRSKPTTSASIVKTLYRGATVAIQCQTTGSRVGTSSVWDRLSSGWVADNYVTTPSSTGFSQPIPRCP